MINLLHINNFKIATTQFYSYIMEDSVQYLDKVLTDFVGAKHGCLLNSASTAIFLCLSLES